MHLRSVLMHELGHALGLNHSSWGDRTSGAVMFQAIDPGVAKSLTPDDMVGVSLVHDTVTQIATGLALDIGVSPVWVNFQDVVWVIGTDGSIWKWDGGNGWIHEVGNGDARRIAVDAQGIPYVAAPWGVYRRTSADPMQGTWQMINGSCALDIGVGTTTPTGTAPAVWMVDCDNNVLKFDGLWWNLDIMFPAHQASRIAVDRLGTPWVIKTGSQIVYHRSSSDPTSGSYADLPGGSIDIGASPFPHAWAVSVFQWTNGNILSAFNYQPVNPDDPGGTPARWAWVNFPTGGANIAVGMNGNPWWTDSQGRIFRTTR
jgi:hypothetical protein